MAEHYMAEPGLLGRPLRIALFGPGGSGKTSLVQSLSRHLPHLPVIAEQVRTSMAELGITNLSNLSDPERSVLQTWALHSQVVEEKQNCQTGFISDRSVFDYMRYWNLFDLDEGAGSALRVAAYSGKRYDLLVYVPPHSPIPEEDNVRLVDPRFVQRERYQFEQVADLLSTTMVPSLRLLVGSVMRVKSTTIEDRTAEVLAHIDTLCREK